MTNHPELPACGVCRARQWRPRYQGPIRHGTFGTAVSATVYECESCGVGFLPTSVVENPDFYRTTDYRHLIGEGADAEAFFRRHDTEQLSRYSLFERVTVRDRVLADVGCGGGSFLDGVAGLASTTIGIEPATSYHDSLTRRGHIVFGDLIGACKLWAGRVDVAVCFSVIEHVSEPVEFLGRIRRLLSPDGRLLVSTPNSQDVLMHVGCEAYRQFFYRSVHTYYFDRDSLTTAALAAGFRECAPIYVHRFNFGNFVGWLNEHKPSGNVRLDAAGLGNRFDRIWKTELEEAGRSDYLYAWLT
jgi:SAM-dependent methyltransferase